MSCCGGDGDDNERRRDSDENDYGETLKYDKNFKGPLSKRSCTDVCCLFIFIVFLCVWGFIAHFAIKNGDLDRLLVPTDSQGRKCGVDNSVINEPYLLFFNLEKCIDARVPLFGCKTPQVCVRECPTTAFIYSEYICNSAKFYEIREKLICQKHVNKFAITDCTAIKRSIDNGDCARWYLPSNPFLKRCISGLPQNECPIFPKSILKQARSQRYRRSVTQNDTALSLNRIGRSPIRFPDNLTALSQTAVNEPPLDCKERNKLGTQILIEKGHYTDSMLSRFVGNFIMIFSNQTNAQEMGQRIVEDVLKIRWEIGADIFIAMFFCLIVIAVMRWVATPLVWLSILGVIVMLGFGTYYSFKEYVHLRDRPPTDVNVNTNLSLLFDTWLQNPTTWLVFGIVAAVLLLIILLVVLVLRKRIVIAIALVKEGSKVVSSIYSTVFFPIFPWIFQIAVTAFAIAVGLYLASIGTPVNQVLRMREDSNCQCSGIASHYTDGVMCVPELFNQFCKDKTSGNECIKAACNFKEIQSPPIVPYYQAFNVFGFFWGIFFVSALGEMVLAATFATWYWTFHKKDVPYFTLTVGLGRSIRYHLGTVAFGSLVITICRVIRVLLEYVDQKLKKWDNEVTRCILCCCKCFFWCLERFLRFLSKNAYIMCAIHGKPFCTSARDAFNLLMRNFLRVVALDKVTEFLFFLTKILVTVGMGAVTYAYFTSEAYAEKLNYVQVPVVIVMFATYLIASVFFGVYSMAVDTLFLCFLEDCERNDGSEEKPYFMSKQLMKILGRKNIIPRDQYRES
ncbi:choline transporter-like 2 isoform X2 [Sitodiplosis mosellana]|uniref:choline transporter-like 2 isoform X2 n=1 Tax=Sitodiplosis mosellana TaxID=263140 RepID=UPI002444F745|nr:choline transporter-like 2 isoform X2 [Sitodiplosis mosellana]XP_055298680.1 choline transporter-like 2 isoform X2 [Sitodiplosis mosellana]XP_055298684.1 choline transporter-like 2 isoform X2 [Sitodiplosis mosellana]XP_055298692.1 choline transporter-like 2 isoform X2 [Sitodiplosis mosellana]XP_055298699.1 choline transporter-like 2 isoform X2 [Sitodiplosis mosellana]XP_055298709.1 choline transporter-like 2 isoform X2 [Sitodiplosis mosellana]XP_055298717.1 choline transporter-like 2 isofo